MFHMEDFKMAIRNVGGKSDPTSMIMMIMEMRAQERRAEEKSAQSDRKFNLQMEQFKSQSARQERSERMGREDAQLKQIADQFGIDSKEYREAATHFGRFSPTVASEVNAEDKASEFGLAGKIKDIATSTALGEKLIGKGGVEAVRQAGKKFIENPLRGVLGAATFEEPTPEELAGLPVQGGRTASARDIDGGDIDIEGGQFNGIPIAPGARDALAQELGRERQQQIQGTDIGKILELLTSARPRQ